MNRYGTPQFYAEQKRRRQSRAFAAACQEHQDELRQMEMVANGQSACADTEKQETEEAS